ncbi:hypothetical protein EGT47_27630 [Burkholderia cenocepacia]|nr:hypothetical protein EGT47_27630 [Burkholderia cenocepacia]
MASFVLLSNCGAVIPAALIAACRFANSVAVEPSSTEFWPEKFAVNCASTAAMIELWRHTLLSCADSAVPD